VGLGPGCTARKCIIDKNSRIGANVQIVNKDGVQVRFGNAWQPSDGIGSMNTSSKGCSCFNTH
jgi:ADP-glucose pyrophosphorylase